MAAVTSTVIAAGAGAYNAYQSWDAAQDAKADSKKIQELKSSQASDILEQIENEELIYQDDLEMIRKQTALSEEKLNLQMSSAFDQTGDKLSEVVSNTYGGKFEGGAGSRIAQKARQKMKESSVDLIESFELGQKEIALQNEEAERNAEKRKDDIIGSLESAFMEATGKDIEDADEWQNNEDRKKAIMESLKGASSAAEIFAAMSGS